ncbi:MAG: heme lyase CcmF/NrfE family subunit [Acidobacteria bacterium]|nr:MAG: heme lyase CcmF/NrfE family subunit [Acidobacteriota bacterium]
MAEIGFYLLYIGLGVAALSVASSLMGVFTHSPSLIRVGERGSLALLAIVTLTMILLARLFLMDDFAVQYVAEHSSRSTPTLYKFTALWGGQSGSLLLWVWIQSIYTAAVVLTNRRKNRDLMPYANAVLSGITAFFLVTLCFASNPFLRLAAVPLDGAGLNPLLQNPMMAIHPPTLYVGYIGFSVPFAFAMAALASGRTGDTWIRTSRRWTLFTWFVLGTGILLGSWWAYLELGWGGYWAWDPVENASLMPWLTGTAYLHSVMIQERRRMLKVWNMVLIAASFALSILGTFITRSGVISSVHSFAQSSVGYYFLFFLVVIVFSSIAMILYRLPELSARNRVESILSKESAFLFNNVLLLGITFAVLWGTLFPILSEWVRGTKITVTLTWFNHFNVPLGLALLLLMGIGPLLAWRKTSTVLLLRSFRWPVLITVAGSAALVILGVRDVMAAMSYTFCLFVLACTAIEVLHGAAARRRLHGEGLISSLVHLVGNNKRRYGGYIVHVGIVMIFLGITGSSAFQQETTATVKPGESFQLGPYTLTYQEVIFQRTARAESYTSRVDVARHGTPVATLHPAREIFPSFRNQPATEVDIYHALSEDLYVVLLTTTDAGGATFKVYLNPLISWIWLGGVVLLLGGFITMLPDVRERRFAYQASLELKRVAT